VDIGLFPGGGFHDASGLRSLGAAAEDRGFHSLWFPEHIVLFDEIDSLSPFTGRRALAAGTSPMLDPLTCVTFVAASTQRIRLGTGICVLPLRDPVFLAKEAATIDVLSGGRLDLGVGVGWVKEEFDVIGVPFDQRGSITDRNLAVMETLWTDDVSHYEDEKYRLPPCHQYPKPVQRPHVPVHIGGTSTAALRRVARYAQGWYPFNITPADLAPLLLVLEGMLTDQGRSRAEIVVSVCAFMSTVDIEDVKRFRDAGADQVILFEPGLAPDPRSRLDALVTEIVEPAAAL
jgi:probable F420-dependent oxidoreductase